MKSQQHRGRNIKTKEISHYEILVQTIGKYKLKGRMTKSKPWIEKIEKYCVIKTLIINPGL